MANPQKENGHTDIANEIVEVLAKINLRPYEWRTLWALWRKTWGWHKKEDKISLTQFQELTGLERRHQRKALKTLIEKNIITRNRDSYIVNYSFQKDYSVWKVVLKQAPLSNTSTGAYLSTTPVLKQAPKLVPKSAPTKENKETNTKEIDTILNSIKNSNHLTGNIILGWLKGVPDSQHGKIKQAYCEKWVRNNWENGSYNLKLYTDAEDQYYRQQLKGGFL